MAEQSVSAADLTGKQKAAMLVISLGQQVSVRLLKLLSEEEIEGITVEVANFKKVDSHLHEEILREFYHRLVDQKHIIQGGVDYAREILNSTLGIDRAEEIVGRLSSYLRATPFEFLKQTDAEQLLGFIQHEQPQTIALIMSYLAPESAATVLGGLPPETQVDVVQRIAKMDRTSPKIIREVERVLEQKVNEAVTAEAAQVGGLRNLIEMLNRIDRGTEKEIMEKLDDSDPQLADEIRRLRFVFEDIRILDERAIRTLLGQADRKDLALALKSVSDDVKHKILRNMSKRAAASLEEDLDFMGPVRLRDVEDAQQRIVNVIRHLADSGEIVVDRGGKVTIA